MSILKTLLNYLAQASTWQGLIGLVTAFGIAIKPELIQSIIAFGLAAAGLVKVFIEGSAMDIKAKAEDEKKAGV